MSDDEYDRLSDDAFSDEEKPMPPRRPLPQPKKQSETKKPQPRPRLGAAAAAAAAEKKRERVPAAAAAAAAAAATVAPLVPLPQRLVVATAGFHMRSEKGRQKGHRGLWPARCFGVGAGWGNEPLKPSPP